MSNVYINGEFAIDRGSYGADHGLRWGLWRNGELQYDFATLTKAKRAGHDLGAKVGGWVRQGAASEVVEVQP
jgi:hypothetical protein